jgi:hypothetical protein
MTEEEEKFNIWKSQVELHLESMVKKSLSELKVNPDMLLRDFRSDKDPHATATKIIRRSYNKNGVDEISKDQP